MVKERKRGREEGEGQMRERRQANMQNADAFSRLAHSLHCIQTQTEHVTRADSFKLAQ